MKSEAIKPDRITKPIQQEDDSVEQLDDEL
jgi:hypothetical protein